MTVTITKTKLALAILAMALLAPATALATHVFGDVPDDAFYADPVEWAFDNAITTGKSATTFAPLDNVTRGESVTFLKRYNDNVVEVADAALQADIDANEAAAASQSDLASAEAALARLGTMYWAVIDSDGSIISRSTGVNSDVTETRRLGEGEYEVDFTGTEDVGDCHVVVSRSDSTSTGVGKGQIYAEGRLTDASSIFIQTSGSSGIETDSPFTLQLWCSPAAFNIVIVATADVADASDPDQQD